MKRIFLKNNELIVVNGKRVSFVSNNGEISSKLEQTMTRKEINGLITKLIEENYEEIE